MATNVPIPNLGDSISQATVLNWLKNEGEYVKIDDILIELETDKVNTDVKASVSGVLHQNCKAGDTVKVGQVIATIDESAAVPAPSDKKSSAPTAAPTPAAPTPAPVMVQSQAPAPAELADVNPSVRPLLIEHKLNPKDIPGTGPHGRLLKEDVLKYLEQNNGKAVAEASPAKSAPVQVTAPPAAVAAPSLPGMVPGNSQSSRPQTSGPGSYDAGGISRVPISKIRKRIALNLKEAQNTAAILTTYNEVDMSAITDLRAKHKERFEKAYGVGLGFMSFFARAAILGLREFPRINAFIDRDDIVYHNYVNLGIAVSTDRGLLVPILKNAEQMSFAKIESEIKRVAGAARDGKLGLSELSGGTFTITNGGVFGSLLSTPILSPPQSGILGMHAIVKRPIAVGDEVKIRPMMYIALSYDHRLVDGRESVSFLVRLKEYLEDPARLMLEI
jgi:2-oxoglutarate dehydrogenase E2 component (dihydrolipoamide succinyltransferase)